MLVLSLACGLLAAQARLGIAATPVSKPVDGTSAAFADTIGVGIAPFYSDTAYDDKPRLKQLLLDLGVKHLRAGIRLGRFGYEYASARDLAASGMKFEWITGRPGSTIDPSGFVSAAQALSDPNRLLGTAEALEGPNEFDQEEWRYPNWNQMLYDYMRETYAGFKAAPLFSSMLHYGPSFVDNRKREQYAAMTAAGNLMDAPNAHIYGGGRPPENAIRSQVADVSADFGSPNRRGVISETGTHTAVNGGNWWHYGVSERAQSIYTLRTFLAAFGMKVPRTYIYGFMDLKPDPGKTDLEQQFGLVGVEGDPQAPQSTWQTRPKQAYYSLKELLELTRDSGVTPGPSSLTYALSGGAATLQKMLLSRSDGSVDLVLWNQDAVYNDRGFDCDDPRIDPSLSYDDRCFQAMLNYSYDRGDAYPPDVPVTLDLAQPSSIRTERPHSEREFSAARWGTTFTIPVGPDPVFVRIAPSRYAAAVKADHPSAYLRFDESAGRAVDSAGLGASADPWAAAPTYGTAGAIDDGNPAIRVEGNQRTTVRLPAPVNTTAGTSIELWVKPDPAVSNFADFLRGDGPDPWRAKMRTYNQHDGRWWGSVYGSTPGAGGEMIFDRFDYGRWHHLVLSLVGGLSTTYLDGRMVGSTSGGENFNLSQFAIGGLDGFTGDLDELAVYPVVLTAQQVCAHYKAAGGSC